MNSIAATVDALVDGYRRMTPPLDSQTARLAVGLWRSLAQGEPVDLDTLATRTGVARGAVDEALAGPLAGTFAADDEGRIRAFWALSLADQVSPHRLELDGRTLYAWCAVDTLFLPLLLGRELRVRSTLTTTRASVELLIGPDEIREVQGPKTMAVSFVPASPEGFGDSPASIMSTYCHHMLFFPDVEAGEEWAADRSHPELVLLPLADAFGVSQRWYRALLGDALEAPVQ